MRRAHIEIEALRKAVAYLGSQSELARRSGVPQGYITKYLSGMVKTISDDVWDKLEPHLRRFMPSDAGGASRPAPNPESIPERPAPATPAPSAALSAKEQVLVEAFRELGSEEQKSVLACLLSGKPACAYTRPSPCPRPYDSSASPADAGSSDGTSAA
jgi:transcriptional regulator with XRE-family HTH domain